MKKQALLIIDVQKGFDEPFWGERNNLQAEENIVRLLHRWRQLQLPVIHVQHCSSDPNSPLYPSHTGHAFKDVASPIAGEKHFKKSVNSAFIGTDLALYLYQEGIEDLVIVGLTTDHCVSTTTRMAGNLGFNAVLVEDATATFAKRGISGEIYSADLIHHVHLASLDGEFCAVCTTDAVLKLLS